MDPFIQSVAVPNTTHPLYDHIANPMKCYFSLTSQNIWDQNEAAKTPVAISETTNFALTFLPTAIATKFPSLTAPYNITAKLGTMVVFNQIFTSPTAIELSKLVLQKPTANGLPGGVAKNLPWCFVGELDWDLKGAKPNDPIYKCKTDVEFYALPAALPEYFQTSGIPLALLREARYLPAWMKDSETDWAKFATTALFSDDRLEYEIYSGSSKYVSNRSSFKELFTNNGGVECWLDLWLSDLKGVALQQAKHTVNCYDLAALCQALVSLGIDPSTQAVRMKYMQPFGYINQTRLIGRKQDPPDPVKNPNDLCNNPFYDKVNGLPMLCWVDAYERSAFGNHMFLTISKANEHYVLDACCGPKVGDLTLDAYVTQAIDARPTRYEQSNNPNTYELGDTSDITDGQGVAQLITSRCFEKQGDPNKPGPSLLDQLSKEFKADGTWHQPYLSTPQGNWQITATWTFQPKNNAAEIITVNVFGYEDAGDVLHEYKRRKSAIPGWITNAPLGDDDAFNDTNVNGSSRMFYNDANVAPLYLCTIDTRIGKATTTDNFRTRVRKVLDACLNGQYRYLLDKVTVNPKGPIKVGSSVVLSPQGSAKAVNYWRGFNILVPRSNVLFTDCKVKKDQKGVATGVDFHLLARKPGFVTVVISMFGGNLEVSEKYVNLQVIDP